MSDTISIPECEKWSKVAPEFSDLQESIELLESMGFHISHMMGDEEYTKLVTSTELEIERAFMNHKGIDRQALEQERQAILERAQAKAKDNQQSLEKEQ